MQQKIEQTKILIQKTLLIGGKGMVGGTGLRYYSMSGGFCSALLSEYQKLTSPDFECSAIQALIFRMPFCSFIDVFFRIKTNDRFQPG